MSGRGRWVWVVMLLPGLLGAPALAATTHYVDVNSINPVPPFLDWGTAATTIQDAVDTASPGDIVLVADGVYMNGGRPAGGGLLTNRVVLTNSVTVRSVNGPMHTEITGTGPVGDSAIRCAFIGTNATLSGFTLKNGATRLSECGGGAIVETGGTVNNCVFRDNQAGHMGGGLYGGTAANCVLTCNSSVNSGGGAAQATLINCNVVRNSSTNASGGTYECAHYNTIVYGNAGVYVSWHGCWCPNTSGGTFFNSWTAHSSTGIDTNYDPRLASAFCLSMDSPCIGMGSSDRVSGTDIHGEPWLNPPSIGADEFTVGQTIGPMTLTIERSPWPISRGSGGFFYADIQGRVSSNAWDFGDGSGMGNSVKVYHMWTNRGDYVVTLTAYNEDHPQGISTSMTVHVSSPITFYVRKDNFWPPEYPYTRWETAASNIQDAIRAAEMDPGSTVLVWRGTYDTGGAMTPGGTILSRIVATNNITIRSVDGPDETSIVGQGPPGPDAVRGVFLSGGAVLEGFTITEGRLSTSGQYQEKGGGILAEGGTIRNCRVESNTAFYGGGIWCRNTVIEDCWIRGNGGYENGGINASSSTVIRCVIAHNSGYGMGGLKLADGVLLNCMVVSNSAAYNGGGRCERSTVRNCLVADNRVTVNVGGVSFASCDVANCTVAGNIASQHVGGAAGDAGTAIRNSIFSYNAIGLPYPEADQDLNGDCIATYSCVPPTVYPPAPRTNEGNILASAQFVDAAAGDYHLATNSPCIDAGTNMNWMAAAIDLDGNPRIINGTVDMGCYELTPTPSHCVDADSVNPVPPYSSWSTAATQIQDAVNIALTGEVIRVAAGAYGKFKATNTLTIIGESGASNTVIDNAGDGHVVLGSDTVLEGFTVKNGGAPYAQIHGGGVNGGMLIGCIVVSNTAAYGGGAYGSRLSGCQLLHNQAPVNGGGGPPGFPGYGGGAYECVLSNCVVAQNWGSYGGGVAKCEVFDSTLVANGAGPSGDQSGAGGGAFESKLERCWFKANYAGTGAGGGLDLSEAFDCVIQYNSAATGGGAFNSYLENCSVADNYAYGGGGGGGTYGGTNLNSIIYHNHADQWTNYYAGDIQYSCTTPPTNGPGNLSADPLWTDGLLLCSESPCVNAGTNIPGIADRRDVNGEVRVLDEYVDLGAYEGPYPTGMLAEALSYRVAPSSLCISNTYSVVLDYVAAVTDRAPRTVTVNLLNVGNGWSWHGGTELYQIPAGTRGSVTGRVTVLGSAAVGTNYQWSSYIGSHGDWQQAYRLVEQWGVVVREPDADEDGLPDTYELQFSGTTTNMTAGGDEDRDGFSNWNEFIAGTCPTNGDEYLNMWVRSTNGPQGLLVVVGWWSQSGKFYDVERGENLTVPFVVLGSRISGEPPINYFLDTSATAEVPFFYRIKVRP